ncbi:hypothetical protein BO71DRAFT_397352 [Aspergillus ellipticus CBS 707.79]|uniref:Uncharacterized protein n=1 Tax=Aspergillus ellipticus CBS 707.79 TaxID=1448320 RepID=A0A319DG27_9EURO|nr:hypothetical protein BO71DRAFT_397352 [Aspergillus ellipticus CBS 707.79]
MKGFISSANERPRPRYTGRGPGEGGEGHEESSSDQKGRGSKRKPVPRPNAPPTCRGARRGMMTGRRKKNPNKPSLAQADNSRGWDPGCESRKVCCVIRPHPHWGNSPGAFRVPQAKALEGSVLWTSTHSLAVTGRCRWTPGWVQHRSQSRARRRGREGIGQEAWGPADRGYWRAQGQPLDPSLKSPPSSRLPPITTLRPVVVVRIFSA